MTALAPVSATAPPQEKRRGGGRAPNADPAVMRAGIGTALLFVGPYLVLFCTFVLAPILYGLWISLHTWDFLLPGKPFVGLQNYIDLFTPGSTTSEPFWSSMRATAIFTVLSVPLLMALPLALAVALNKKFHGRNAMRAIFFAPYVLGVAVIGLLWRYLLDPNVGVVNYYLDQLGFDRIPFTTATPWVWLALVVPTIWWTAGYNMVIFLAGLQDISPELYEAAELDGASIWQRLRHVTLPQMRFIMLVLLLLQIVATMQVFIEPFALTGTSNPDTITVLVLVYRYAFTVNQDFGLAAAMSMLLFVVLGAFSALYLRLTRTAD
jgi:multiple sugar transport system permease protein